MLTSQTSGTTQKQICMLVKWLGLIMISCWKLRLVHNFTSYSLCLCKSDVINWFELFPSLGEVDAGLVLQVAGLHLNEGQILQVQTTAQCKKKEHNRYWQLWGMSTSTDKSDLVVGQNTRLFNDNDLTLNGLQSSVLST